MRCDSSADFRQACHGRGNCTVYGVCECDEGFYGELCQLSVCPNSWTAAECSCCPSGVLSATGACCEMINGTVPLLDKDGECCNAGRLDALGTCGGKCTNVDRYGNCCEVRTNTLAPQGTIVTVLRSHCSTRSQMWRHRRSRCSGHLVRNLQACTNRCLQSRLARLPPLQQLSSRSCCTQAVMLDGQQECCPSGVLDFVRTPTAPAIGCSD